MAVFGALNAGSLFVEYGMKPDKSSFREYDSQLDRAVKHAKDTERATGRQELGIGVDKSGFNKYDRALKNAEGAARRASNAASRVGRIGAAGLIGLGTAAAGAGWKMIQLASDAQETASKFKIVFGKETDRAIKQLDKFSEATGTSRFTLREQAADLQALLKPMGMNDKAAAKMSISLTQLATDMGSFNNASIEETLLAIRSGLVGESEPLRRFSVNLNAAAIEAKAHAQGVKASYNEMTSAQKAAATYALIMEQTKIQQGDAARTSESFANQLKNLKSDIKDISTEFGLAILPSVTTVVNALGRTLNQATPAIKAFAEKVGDIMNGPGGFQFKLERVWQEFDKSGAPDKIQEILVTAFTKAAENGIKTIVTVFNNANMWGKLAITGLLAAKFAPAIVGAFGLASKALGRLGGGKGKGAAGALGGVGGGPLPVYVTNWGGAGGAGVAGAGGKAGLKGVAAVASGALRLVGVAGMVLLINEIFKALGLPSAESIGAGIAKKFYGDSAKMSDAQKRQRTATNQIYNIANRPAGQRADTPARLSQMVNSTWDAGDNRTRAVTARTMLRTIEVLEQQGKLKTGTLKKVIEEMGTRVIAMGGYVSNATQKTNKGFASMTTGAAIMRQNTNQQFERVARKSEDMATRVERSTSRARAALTGKVKAGEAFTTTVGATTGPVRPVRAATGAYVSGPRHKGVPVTLHGDEYVINARQAAMVGRDRLNAALAATGAPVISAGGSYKKGGKPKVDRNYPVIPGQQKYDDEMLVLDARLADAETTPSIADDNSVRATIRARIKQRIDALTRFLGMPKYSQKKWPQMWRLLTGERTSLTRSLSMYDPLTEAVSDAVTRTQSPAEAAAALLSARTDLYRDYGSNFATAGPGGAFAGARSGATVNVPVTFTEPPRDPHAFAKSLAFELRGAL